jgi:glycosyltransferase involved in cell wall biosynthesis
MKIAVYTIALNEEKHVERWYESAKDADYLLIADTGSKDKTKRIAKKLGINVIDISIKPWRFDDARNAALALLPDDVDYCVSMDMDETLSEGWRECLEKMTSDNVEYKFNLTYRDEAETVVEDFFINNRIHKRHGFRWEHLMHENLVPNRNKNLTSSFCEGLEVSHHPDNDKSRQQYDQMIEDAYEEYKDARYHVYHGMQLMTFGRLDEAAKIWRDYINLEESKSVFDVAIAWRNLSICEPKNRLKFLKKSINVKKSREAYLDLAVYYYEKEKWNKCYKYAKSGLDIASKTLSLLGSKFAHGYLLDNLASVSNYNRKMLKFSKNYKKNKRTMNIESLISHNFKLFED